MLSFSEIVPNLVKLLTAHSIPARSIGLTVCCGDEMFFIFVAPDYVNVFFVMSFTSHISEDHFQNVFRLYHHSSTEAYGHF